jgi:Cdc6-like AAA superfamily ATPase
MATMKPKTQEDWDALRTDITEAFSPGAPVQEKDLFSGRTSQIKSLMDAVSQRGRHAIVYGERGVGKTSLVNILQLVMHRPNRELVYIRVNADPNDTFTTLWKKVFKRMSYVTESREGQQISKKVSEDFKSDITPDDVQIVLSDFTENHNPIVVLDEFDRIKDQATVHLIADSIKSLSDYSVNATVVIVGVAEDISSLIKGHESVTRALIQIRMPRMSPEEIKQLLLARYSRCGISTDADAVWKIAFLSRGLPYYAHLLGMNAARYCVENKKTTVKHEDVDKALDNSISELDQSIKEKYVLATRTQKSDGVLYPSVLLACAFANTDELGRFQQSAVISPLNKILPEKNYQPSTFALHMNAFCEEERGCVLQRFGTVRNYRYRFSDPMMQPFVILKGLNEERITDQIADIFSTKPQLSLDLEFSTEPLRR